MNPPSFSSNPAFAAPPFPATDAVRRVFERNFEFYNNNASIQKRMARRLVELLASIRTDFDAVLELGVGTGLTTDELARQTRWNSLRLCDIQKTAVQTARRFSGSTFERRDLNDLSAPENDAPENEKSVWNDVDLVLSGATFQWIERLPELFDAISRSLSARRGLFAFSTFAPGHFAEIREIAGVSLPYRSEVELSELLTRRNFEILRREEGCERQFFGEPIDILRSLKYSGVNRVGPPPQNPRCFLRKFCVEYQRFRTPDGLYPITWRPLYFVARRCDRSRRDKREVGVF